ncbi:MAG TPA: hypothetical protein VGR35_11325 [Tepidisphaeraceae bacterium]|nr:hypothetical protein [Tepidisphaeraceae bacterium]
MIEITVGGRIARGTLHDGELPLYAYRINLGDAHDAQGREHDFGHAPTLALCRWIRARRAEQDRTHIELRLPDVLWIAALVTQCVCPLRDVVR